MEASLPISAAVKVSAARSKVSAPTSKVSPASVKVPLAFMLAGLLAFFVGVTWIIARPNLLATYHYNQFAVAMTHLFVLGWLCSVVMGAMYQLVPVALETRLYSERLARVQLLCHLVGVAGMVWSFNAWNLKLVGHFGSVLAFGVALFVYNLARTLKRVPKWNVVASAVAAALVWFSIAVTAGLTIAAGKCSYESADSTAPSTILSGLLQGLRSVGPFMARFDAISAMHAHAHLGGVGFFIMLLVGISYKLVPMFTLSEVQCRKRATLSLVLLNVGLAGSFLAILLRSPWKPALALVLVLALAVYGWELSAILSARKRRALDWGLKTFLTGICMLLPLSVLALVLVWPHLPLNALTGQLENLYGFLALVGVVSLAIIGMLYKILPFLVWFGTYSKQIGLAQVPALADLYSEPLQRAGYFGFGSAILAVSIGIVTTSSAVVRVGGLLLGAASLTLAFNVALMLIHFVRPKLKPLPIAGAPAPLKP